MNNPKLFAVLLLLTSFIIYTGFVYTIGTGKNNPVVLTQEIQQGKMLWQEKNCTACHQLYGLGGYMGPDLTNVISAKGKGEFYTEIFLRSGTQVMPNFHFSNDEVKSLIAFLKYVDASGKFPVRDFELTSYGTVRTKNSATENINH